MLRLEKLPTPQGVGAGQTATLNLPLGPTYQAFFIRMTVRNADNNVINVPASAFDDYIDDIRLMVNGDNRIEINAKDLMGLNEYYGRPTQGGVLPLYLSQPNARTAIGENATAYGTATNVASLTLEIELKDGITVDRLTVYAKQSAPKAFGSHLRIQRFSEQASLVGENEIDGIPRGAYNMMALHMTTAAISDIEVLADNRKVHESDRVLRAAEQKINGRTPQSDMTHIDFMTENLLDHTLPMALNDFRLRLDMNSPDQNFKIYAVSIQGVQ